MQGDVLHPQAAHGDIATLPDSGDSLVRAARARAEGRNDIAPVDGASRDEWVHAAHAAFITQDRALATRALAALEQSEAESLAAGFAQLLVGPPGQVMRQSTARGVFDETLLGALNADANDDALTRARRAVRMARSEEVALRLGDVLEDMLLEQPKLDLGEYLAEVAAKPRAERAAAIEAATKRLTRNERRRVWGGSALAAVAAMGVIASLVWTAGDDVSADVQTLATETTPVDTVVAEAAPPTEAQETEPLEAAPIATTRPEESTQVLPESELEVDEPVSEESDESDDATDEAERARQRARRLRARRRRQRAQAGQGGAAESSGLETLPWNGR